MSDFWFVFRMLCVAVATTYWLHHKMCVIEMNKADALSWESSCNLYMRRRHKRPVDTMKRCIDDAIEEYLHDTLQLVFLVSIEWRWSIGRLLNSTWRPLRWFHSTNSRSRESECSPSLRQSTWLCDNDILAISVMRFAWNICVYDHHCNV
jgi:hypothetical protein